MYNRISYDCGVALPYLVSVIMCNRQQQSRELMPHLMRALAFMQMIEEALRLYVGTAEQLIAAAAPYGVPFRVDRKGIEKAALGTITTMFEKVNRNTELIRSLRDLPQHRNYLAHAAFMHSIRGVHDESIDLEYAKTHAIAVGDQAEKLVSLIGQEMRSLLLNFPSSRSGSIVSTVEVDS